MTASIMPLYLSGSPGGQFIVWTLDRPRLTVGRSSRNELQLGDFTVSKEHAEILVDGSHVLIRDLGSRNGTRVNGVDAREALPLKPGDQVEIGHVALVATAERPQQPLALDERAVAGSSHRIHIDQVLERRALSSASATSLVRLLSQAGQLLVLPRPLKETCDQILEIVAQAVPASRYVVLIQEKKDAPPVQVAARIRAGATDKPLMLSRAILHTVLDDCSSVLTADAAEDLRFKAQESIVAQAVHSAMAVPLFDNEQVLGLIYVDRQDLTGPFAQEQLEVLTLLANMAAVKITNSRLLEAEQEARQLAQQLETAVTIQRNLLPPRPPELPGYQLDAYLESCYAVGGDLFDYHRMPDGRLLFLIGDVSGKGLGAALVMTSFLSAARVLYGSCADVGELATRLSRALQYNIDPGRFVTGVIACLDPASGRLDYVNAGHPAPCVVTGTELHELPATGVPFGVLPDVPYELATANIGRGALVAVFSDGIPEAQRGREFFDDERLRRALCEAAGLPELAAVRASILARVDEFLGGVKRTDDLTLLLLRRAAS
jgi:sigma-B regulation protein RsbU (phosphoserine phosphatase)